MDELLGTRAQPERWSHSGSLCAEVGTGRAVLSPFLAPALFLRCASDSFSLTKPNTSCKIEWPASLRSEGVRVHPGMPFGFPSETAFGFAGILNSLGLRIERLSANAAGSGLSLSDETE